jgi:hypothetical protein
MQLVKQVSGIGHFIRSLQVRLRFGDLSRAPLRLLRLEVREDTVECDWMVRPSDPWDVDLPQYVRERRGSEQALQDAIAVRELVLCAIPGIQTGVLRAFRPSATGHPELVISGEVTREQPAARYFHSLAMRAKSLGLQFWLEDGILMALRSKECAMSY